MRVDPACVCGHGNHFHLAVETPKGNLSSGMQWLQSTFANRFNRFRHVNGHLSRKRLAGLSITHNLATTGVWKRGVWKRGHYFTFAVLVL
jgi:REP element-mobilizing transposase RayT